LNFEDFEKAKGDKKWITLVQNASKNYKQKVKLFGNHLTL